MIGIVAEYDLINVLLRENSLRETPARDSRIGSHVQTRFDFCGNSNFLRETEIGFATI